MRLPAYVVITPARDEEDTIGATLASVTSQSVLPLRWVIVDDGSIDRTPAIVSEYASNHPWIRLVRRTNRGVYRLGGNVVQAFYDGLDYVDLSTVDFICKLDGDLELSSEYFEQLLRRAAEDTELGILSGVTYFVRGNRSVVESVPTSYAVGMAKLWRVACFEDIGGLVPALGWDALDVIRAQMRGWKTRSYPQLRILHLRPMSSKGNWYTGRIRNGLTDYVLGYHPLFELARCIYRMTYPPYVVGGVLMLYGYVRAALRGEGQIVNAEERAFLRKQQLGRLIELKIR